MAFQAFSSAEMDANSPWTETLTQRIRTNFDDHESRILALSAFGDNAIIDDFVGASIGSWWTADGSAGEAPVIASQHQAQCFTAAAADWSALVGADSRIRINLTHEYVAVFQCRVYKAAGTDDNFFFGWQDTGVATGSSAIISDNSDRIGFYRDPGAAAWVFETANGAGGGGGATATTGVGTSTAWGVYRITVTCSGTAGNRQIVVEAGTTEANLAAISGSPFTNATGDLPTAVSLRPVLGVHRAGATNLDLRVDYVLAYTTGRPLAA